MPVRTHNWSWTEEEIQQVLKALPSDPFDALDFRAAVRHATRFTGGAAVATGLLRRLLVLGRIRRFDRVGREVRYARC